jgi:hypothetical protein
MGFEPANDAVVFAVVVVVCDSVCTHTLACMYTSSQSINYKNVIQLTTRERERDKAKRIFNMKLTRHAKRRIVADICREFNTHQMGIRYRYRY